MQLRDASDWSPMSYPQAVDWLIQNNDTAWIDGSRKLSPRAIVMCDLFKKSPDALKDDVRAALSR